MRPLSENELHVIIIDDQISTGMQQKIMFKTLAKIGIPLDRIHTYVSEEDYFSKEATEISKWDRRVYFVDYHLGEGKIGTDIIRKIREHEKTCGRTSYILGWSSDETDVCQTDFRRAGANAILVKKVNSEGLTAALQEASDFYEDPLNGLCRKLSQFSLGTEFSPSSQGRLFSARSSTDESPELLRWVVARR